MMKKLLWAAVPVLFLAGCKNAYDQDASEAFDGPAVDPATAYVDGGSEPILDGARQLYVSHSSLWTGMPALDVETWLNGKAPDMKGNFLLVTFWNTWCPPCRRSLPIFSDFQKKFKDDMVVIEITDEPEDVVRAFLSKRSAYEANFAIDTKARMKKTIGVLGVPHTILVEPDEHTIIWEGFPLQKGYELTEGILNRYITRYKESKAK